MVTDTEYRDWTGSTRDRDRRIASMRLVNDARRITTDHWYSEHMFKVAVGVVVFFGVIIGGLL